MQHYPTNRAGHSPIQKVVEAFSHRHIKKTGTRLDELDFVIAVGDIDRARFYVLSVFITTDDSYPLGTILPNHATVVLHPTPNVYGYWSIDLNDNSIAPYALWAIAARGGQSHPYSIDTWDGYDVRRMWFPLAPRDLHSIVPAAVHRTDSAA